MVVAQLADSPFNDENEAELMIWLIATNGGAAKKWHVTHSEGRAYKSCFPNVSLTMTIQDSSCPNHSGFSIAMD